MTESYKLYTDAIDAAFKAKQAVEAAFRAMQATPEGQQWFALVQVSSEADHALRKAREAWEAEQNDPITEATKYA